MSQTSSATPVKLVNPVLFVLTSHGTKGITGQPTGYYLGEVTHPLAELQDAGIPVDFASIQGGEPPVDGLDLNDVVNERYWGDTTFREPSGTPSLWVRSMPRSTPASFSPAATARCGTSPAMPTSSV